MITNSSHFLINLNKTNNIQTEHKHFLLAWILHGEEARNVTHNFLIVTEAGIKPFIMRYFIWYQANGFYNSERPFDIAIILI